MADTTISSLPQGTPSGNHLLPYSTGNSTLGVPTSAILQNAGNIGIGTSTPVQKLDVNGGISMGSGNGEPLVLRKGCDLIIDDGSPTAPAESQFNFFIDNNIAQIRVDKNVDTDCLGSLNIEARGGITLNGIVKNSLQPYVQATVGSIIQPNYNFANYTTPVVRYNIIDRQRGSGYNSDTGIYTAPVAGVYLVNAGVYTCTNAGVVAINICTELWGIINGNRSITFSDYSASTNIPETRHGTGIFYLNAGDTFGVKAFGNTSTGNTIAGSAEHSYLRIVLLG